MNANIKTAIQGDLQVGVKALADALDEFSDTRGPNLKEMQRAQRLMILALTHVTEASDLLKHELDPPILFFRKD